MKKVLLHLALILAASLLLMGQISTHGKLSTHGPITLAGASVSAGIARVEVVVGICSGGTGATCVATFGTATTSGELIVCDRSEGPNTLSPASFTDNQSQSYTAKGTGSLGFETFGYYELSNSVSGVTTITYTVAATDSTNYAGLICGHYTGTATSSFDQLAAFAGNTGSPWASGAVTTTSANEVLIGGNWAFSSTTQAATGSWISRGQNNSVNGDSLLYEDQIVSTIQTGVTATGTSGSSNNMSAIMTCH